MSVLQVSHFLFIYKLDFRGSTPFLLWIFTMAVLFVNIHNFVPYFFGVFLFTTFAHGTFLLNEQSSFKEGIFTQIGHKEGHGDLIIAGQSQELPPFVLKGLLVPYGFLTICLLLRNLHIQEHSVL